MTSSTRNKRGSSRRKGDAFQDFSALRLALELYASGEDFQVFLEYEKTEAIDDIVIFRGKCIRAVQAKYAIDPLSVYVPDDFTDENSPTYFGKYARGWKQANLDHPGFTVSVELLSNRGRDSQLKRIIGADGNFTSDFIDGSLRKEPKTFRDKLAEICAFTEPDAPKQFQAFLRAIHFQLSQRPLDDLRSHLQGEILDHELGISDRAVFLELKELIERHAIDLHEPITRQHLDEIFRKAQRRFLLPQVFPVDASHFVEVPGFGAALRMEIEAMQSGYVVVTGLPGSGKSTSLSEFFDSLANGNGFAVCRYFCFVRSDDDSSHLRLEAEALRVNLLSELQNHFGHLLNRQFDFGEHRFTEVLSELGRSITAQGQKLVILIDGLDHAERDSQVRDSVLRALPTALPPGVIIVAGTQELKHWQPFALREGREQHNVPIPLFTVLETRAFLSGKHGLTLDESTIAAIHEKSQGLPLYLRYVASWLREHGGDPETLQTMPEAGDGDIRNYYARLWANFDQDGMGYARYLCGVLAALRFPVRLDELPEFQSAISSVEMESALRSVIHLLRGEDDQVSVFHDSFRVFVNSQIDAPTRRRIAEDILAKLKRERGSARWFTYVFRYALEAGDDDYLLTEVNRPFVDFALQHCRPAVEIITAIESAAKAATRRHDLVALARLGSLHFRTHERLEQFNYDTLAKVQLSLGRVEDVLGFCCRPNEQRWLVDERVADQIMVWSAKTGHIGLGKQLFKLYLDTHESAPSAAVLGIYSSRPARVLQWLSSIEHRRDTLERIDRFLPGYAPPLEDFLASRFRYGSADDWKRFKRIKRLFPNHLVRHILLRLVAKHKSRADLADELDDYLANTPVSTNLEVAGYAALAGLSATRVRELAGAVSLPPPEVVTHAPFEKTEGDFDRFEWTAMILGYENDPVTIRNITTHLGDAKTMYSGFLRFLLRAGLCLGRSASGNCSNDESYSLAVTALNELAEAGSEDQPDEMETLRACRPMLPEALFRLTDHVATKHSEKLDAWREKLLNLRDSEMWTSHWGITETRVNYSFELRIWERLLAVSGMRSRLMPILRSCAATYEEAASLKGGERCEHFLSLAAIAAACGWRTEAERWRDKGTASSLTYGYHKDITIDYLVDVLELLNKYEAQHGLSRCADILEMAKWMRAATDNRGTKDFEQSAYRVVLQTSREAAFAVIQFFREGIGRWKMLDCLEQYCVATRTGDAFVLWTLKDAFTPHFHEQGRHSKQVISVAQALRAYAQKSQADDTTTWQQKYSAFIRTFVDPAWWPDDIWSEVSATETRVRPQVRDPYSPTPVSPGKEFMLNGVSTPREPIEQLLAISLESFSRTIEQLRSENSYFHEREMISTALEAHAGQTTSRESALHLWQIADATGDSVEPQTLHTIAQRLFDVGESEAGFECLLRAYQHSTEYYYGSHSAQDYLVELCARDQDRVAAFLAERCDKAFTKEYGGFDLPRMVARYYSAINDISRLRQVFEDYLTHCQELFAHLPKNDMYAWLRNYREDGRDEEPEIVTFLIGLVGEPEIEQARRLVRVLADLARVRAEPVCRITCERMVKAEPLLRERLAMLVECLSLICPAALAVHVEMLLSLLKEQHFRLRMTLMRTIRSVAAAVAIPSSVSEAVDLAERDYSPLIAYPARRFFHSEPSAAFVRFLKRAVLFNMHSRISAVSQLLKISLEVILSHFEQTLHRLNWSIGEETERLKDDWRYHAQDKRVVWIVPRFHTQVSELLENFIHQAVENGRYPLKTVRALESVLRTGDPVFVATLPKVKPTDISALPIADGTQWVEELHGPIENRVEMLSPDGWITVYEERLQSRTDGHQPVVTSIVRVRSLLVAPAFATQLGSLPSPESWSDDIPVLHEQERLTIGESQRRLSREALDVDLDNELLPLVATHDNGITFQGFRILAFLHSTWLTHRGLVFDATDLLSDGKCVARLEEWQEGYEDEPYSRNLLSAGMRLVVQTTWLQKTLKDTDRAIVIHTEETRRWFKDFWEEEPSSEATRGVITCYLHKV